MRVVILVAVIAASSWIAGCGPSEECKAKAAEAQAAWREAASFAKQVSNRIERDAGTKSVWLMISSACGTAAMACKADAEVSAGGPIQSIHQMLRTVSSYKQDEFKALYDKADDLYDEKRALCNP